VSAALAEKTAALAEGSAALASAVAQSAGSRDGESGNTTVSYPLPRCFLDPQRS